MTSPRACGVFKDELKKELLKILLELYMGDELLSFFSFLRALKWLIDNPSGSSNAQLTYRLSHASRRA